jgi:H+/Cl- antiporter ClcA
MFLEFLASRFFVFKKKYYEILISAIGFFMGAALVIVPYSVNNISYDKYPYFDGLILAVFGILSFVGIVMMIFLYLSFRFFKKEQSEKIVD